MDANDHIRVTISQGPLPALQASDASQLTRQGAGAWLCFEGVVRPSEGDRPIYGIEYEAYEPMAQNTLERLAQETQERFGVLAIVVEHSTGMVPNFMCSFRLQIASAHRKEGLAAADWFIDAMKREVPIWKHPAWAGDSPNRAEPNDA